MCVRNMRTTYSHVSSSNYGIRYSSMEGSDSNELYSPEKGNTSELTRSIISATHPANEPSKFCTTRNTKNPVEIGGFGNRQTMTAPSRANPRRGQNAHNHGRSGRLPRDQRAAKYPPRIWNGKSMSTTTARSSLPRPFSTTLRLVAASCAAQPILANRCIKRIDWTSTTSQKRVGLKVREESLRLSFKMLQMVL
jgi:hypothetical protein